MLPSALLDDCALWNDNISNTPCELSADSGLQQGKNQFLHFCCVQEWVKCHWEIEIEWYQDSSQSGLTLYAIGEQKIDTIFTQVSIYFMKIAKYWFWKILKNRELTFQFIQSFNLIEGHGGRRFAILNLASERLVERFMKRILEEDPQVTCFQLQQILLAADIHVSITWVYNRLRRIGLTHKKCEYTNVSRLNNWFNHDFLVFYLV